MKSNKAQQRAKEMLERATVVVPEGETLTCGVYVDVLNTLLADVTERVRNGELREPEHISRIVIIDTGETVDGRTLYAVDVKVCSGQTDSEEAA